MTLGAKCVDRLMIGCEWGGTRDVAEWALLERGTRIRAAANLLVKVTTAWSWRLRGFAACSAVWSTTWTLAGSEFTVLNAGYPDWKDVQENPRWSCTMCARVGCAARTFALALSRAPRWV